MNHDDAVTEPEPVTHAGLGLFASLRRMLATLVDLARTRLELIGVEVEAEVLDAARLLLWSIAAMILALVAVLLLVATVLIAFWDTHRLLAACALSAFFTIGAVGVALAVRRRMRTRPRLFAATVEELKRDAEALAGRPR